MSKRGTFEHIEEIAKKKPAVRRALGSYLDGTLDDIDGMPISGWIKSKLKKVWTHRNETGADKLVSVEEYADLMNDKTQRTTDKVPYGKLTRDIEFGVISVEFDKGTPVALISNDRIKTPAGSIKLSQSEIMYVINSVQFEKSILPGEYSQIVQDYYNSIYDHDETQVSENSYDMDSIFSRSVNIQR